MLVELAHAIINTAKLSEFLWEPTVVYVAYVRNCAYTIAIQNETPYQVWHGTKPNVSHLCEFGVPIWILLQGQNIAWKILPKSKWCAYLSYNDANKSVLYYNAETRKILTLQNYVFLTAKPAEPTEEIIITETLTREGEQEEQDTCEVTENTNKQKADMEDKPRKTRGV